MYISKKAKELAEAFWYVVNDMVIDSEKYQKDIELDNKFKLLDNRTIKYLDALCEELNVEKDEIKYIIDNINEYNCFENFLEALEKHINKPYYDVNQVRRNLESVIRRLRYK